jgi:hypothetical protein
MLILRIKNFGVFNSQRSTDINPIQRDEDWSRFLYTLLAGHYFFKKVRSEVPGDGEICIVFNLCNDTLIDMASRCHLSSIVVGQKVVLVDGGEVLSLQHIATNDKRPNEFGNPIGFQEEIPLKDVFSDQRIQLGNTEVILPFHGLIDRLVTEELPVFALEGGDERAVGVLNELNELENRVFSQIGSASHYNRGRINQMIKELEALLKSEESRS